MVENKNKNIMDNLLSIKDDEEKFPEMEELNCLIYRSPYGEVENVEPGSEIDNSRVITRDNATIRVWESKAKIRIKVSKKNKGKISIDRIANIAMDAIVEELKKEDP